MYIDGRPLIYVAVAMCFDMETRSASAAHVFFVRNIAEYEEPYLCNRCSWRSFCKCVCVSSESS